NLEFPIHLTRRSLEVEGSRSTRREPTRTRGEHANSTQKGPAPAGNQTQDLLATNSAAFNFIWKNKTHYLRKSQ
ncbi:hypothetical protein LDENG_00172780, partial [Lucifuga dentata]